MPAPRVRRSLSCACWIGGLVAATTASAQSDPPSAAPSDSKPVVVPRLWDESALADWATPVAGLGVPPGFVSPEEYYAAPVDDLRTYPVYHPSREPKGYRESLLAMGPQPLIEPEKLHGEAEWIAAGRRVFEQLDTPQLRSDEPDLIAQFTDAKEVDRWRDATHDAMDRDGALLDYRWVVDRDRKLMLGVSSCAGCHSRLMPDGSVLPGAPCNFDLNDSPAVNRMLSKLRYVPGASKGREFYAQFGVPWRADDVHARFASMPDEEYSKFWSQDDGAPTGTMFARFNGSPFYMTRMADLRGVHDRRYLDSTGTHLHRGPADIARYGILVEYADAAVFGPHHLLPEGSKVSVRPSDAAIYALALYVESLEPAKSPNPLDAVAQRGARVFDEQKCAACHPPPTYSNERLVPVPGFDPPMDDPRTARLHLSTRRVDTDPGMALRTRKGTGYYRVPSLRGLWYHGLFGHCGVVTTLEEWFDPKRLQPDFIPSGFRGPGVKSMAVPGHEFGLDLEPEDRRALIAFLMTL